MAKIIQKINLEVAKPNLFQAVVAKQNDYGSRFLNVTFVNNGEKIEINPAYTATINAKRPDGTSKRFDSVINDDGTVTAPLTSWMLELTGLVTCDISVLTNEGKLTTTDFSIHVNIAACSDDDITIDEDYDILKDLIYQVETLEAEIEAKVANGEFKGEKGDKGDPGVIKFIPVNTLPEEDIDENAIYMVPTDNANEQNIYEEFIYVNGVWESLGTTQVEVDLTDYVKNTDYATFSKAGLVKCSMPCGTTVDSDGTIMLQAASNYEINDKTSNYKPIVPSTLDYAVKTSITTNTIELTDEEKTAAQNWLGVNGGSDGVGKTTEQGGEIFNDYENNKASGEFSHAEGKETLAEGADSHAEGIKTKATGIESHAEGSNTVAAGAASHAEGYMTQSDGTGTHSEGYMTIADGNGAHAEGHTTQALYDGAHSEGQNTIASGYDAHAEGYGTKAICDFTHAEGCYTNAGMKAFLVGNAGYVGSYATLFISDTEGISEGDIIAYSSQSFNFYCENYGTVVQINGNELYVNCPYGILKSLGINSADYFAGGKKEGEYVWFPNKPNLEYPKTLGICSHSGGFGTVAVRKAQYVIGEFNTLDEQALFVVGNGTGNEDGTAKTRSNAFVVNKDGTATLKTTSTNPNAVVTYQQMVDYVAQALKK